jgi:hypothetical protein
MPATAAPSGRREFEMNLKMFAKEGGAVPPALLQRAVDARVATGIGSDADQRSRVRAVDDAVVAQMALLALGNATGSSTATKNVLCTIVDDGSGHAAES